MWKAGEILELALPVNMLGGAVSFVVIVYRELNGQRVELERHPSRGPITLTVPTADLNARNWSA